MIVFFDILLIDDNVCLRLPHRERRLLLKDIIEPIPGRADISEQWVVDFSHHGGQSRLESVFHKGIDERWEGFVLKACEDPYFTIFSDDKDNPSFGRWIKLKKDWIIYPDWVIPSTSQSSARGITLGMLWQSSKSKSYYGLNSSLDASSIKRWLFNVEPYQNFGCWMLSTTNACMSDSCSS